ncbi:MAG: tripartite tricarboxylate transporter substrate binding protein [Variovorax sp.]|nr:tripartite tricarboxylate transporter substrate binding protein [Variovorax sp.]
MARLVTTSIGRELGEPFVVDNIAGAGGNIGAANAARATPDGYTLLYGTNGTHGINQTLYRKIGFDPRKDFEPIGRLTRIAAILVVRPGLEVSNVQDLLRLARAHPGKLSFGSAGNGTTSHLAGEMLKAQANIDVLHVPYRGGALAMTDLLGGRIDFMIDVAPNVAPQLSGGRVRALAVSTAQRSAAFPDLPTMAQSGVAGFEISAWDALFVPAGTPRPIVETLNAALRRALAHPELRKALLDRAAEPWDSSAEELGQFVASELVRWGDAVKRSGAVIEGGL